MDFLVFGVVFYGIAACGMVVAATLITRALRADQHYLDEVEARADTVTSEPAWVRRELAAATK